MHPLQAEIERLYAATAKGTKKELADARGLFNEFRDALTTGQVRAAEKRDGRWVTAGSKGCTTAAR